MQRLIKRARHQHSRCEWWHSWGQEKIIHTRNFFNFIVQSFFTAGNQVDLRRMRERTASHGLKRIEWTPWELVVSSWNVESFSEMSSWVEMTCAAFSGWSYIRGSWKEKSSWRWNSKQVGRSGGWNHWWFQLTRKLRKSGSHEPSDQQDGGRRSNVQFDR